MVREEFSADHSEKRSHWVWCVLAPNRPFSMTRGAVPLQSHVRAL